jgi:hypothetical protein
LKFWQWDQAIEFAFTTQYRDVMEVSDWRGA